MTDQQEPLLRPIEDYAAFADIPCCGETAAGILYFYQIEPTQGAMLAALTGLAGPVTVERRYQYGDAVSYEGGIGGPYTSPQADYVRGLADCLAWELYLCSK